MNDNPEITLVDVRMIVPGDNDRKTFDPAKLETLAASIGKNGLAQPIVLRMMDVETPDPMYEIVAGERRFRAISTILKWVEIPAIIRDLTDEEASDIMLAENVGRENLDPIEEAIAYQRRIDQYGYTVSEIAEKVGVTSIRVQFRLKLLALREDVQQLVKTGNLDLGYAQILASASLDPNFQLLALRALQENNHPTPKWFRRICGELYKEQAQTSLFDGPLFTGEILSAIVDTVEQESEIPHPSTDKAPITGKSAKEITLNQAKFWMNAASAWDQAGKPFKRQECEAAAEALQNLADSLP
jgi:ParB/RepB/Spo0J family partition protein